MCVEYCALNHATVKYAYPMPLIDELLNELQGYQVVSKLYSLYVPSLEPPYPVRGDARDAGFIRKHHAQCLMQAHSRLQQDAERRRVAAMPTLHRYQSSQSETMFVFL